MSAGQTPDGPDGPSPGRLLAEFGVFAGIFGAAFSVAAFLLPVGGVTQKLVLALLVVCLSALVWRGVTVFARGRLDPLFALLTLLCLGLVASYAVLAIGELERRTAAPDRPAAANPTSTPGPTTTQLPGTTSSPRASTSNTPSTSISPDLPPFDQSPEGVYSNGTATLTLGKYGLLFDSYNRWGSSSGWGGDVDGDGSDVFFGPTGLAGMGGTQFVLLVEPVRKTFTTCREQTTWTPSLTWQQVTRGSFLCLQAASGRRGLLRIDQMPDLDDANPYVIVTGIVWKDIVGR